MLAARAIVASFHGMCAPPVPKRVDESGMKDEESAMNWMKFGRFRLNMGLVSLIERDAARLIFYNSDGVQVFARRFESDRQAEQALRDIFNYEEVRLLTARYEGSEDEGADESE